jgi:hypothetical protein
MNTSMTGPQAVQLIGFRSLTTFCHLPFTGEISAINTDDIVKQITFNTIFSIVMHQL